MARRPLSAIRSVSLSSLNPPSLTLASQTATNPAPDYYAEKVGSLRQYRSWLRDQNIFRRKAAFGSKDEAVL
jgi:import inner membrane translocase subunit TIM23